MTTRKKRNYYSQILQIKWDLDKISYQPKIHDDTHEVMLRKLREVRQLVKRIPTIRRLDDIGKQRKVKDGIRKVS